jgi:hypothetical protein
MLSVALVEASELKPGKRGAGSKSPACGLPGLAGGRSQRFVALIRKRASVSGPSGEWGEDDYDVLARLPDQPAPREACRIADQAARLNVGAEPSCELWTEGGRHHRKSRKGDWQPPPLN